MKLKVLIKYHNPNCRITRKGMWWDCRSSERYMIRKNESKLIELGFSCKLPKWYQGNVVPRSGTFSNYGVIQLNHYGVIDGPEKDTIGYSGNGDIWKFNAYAFKNTIIEEGDRICQFEIRLSANAPWYEKLRWLFVSGFEFIEVDDLGNKNRGGFNSTGVK